MAVSDDQWLARAPLDAPVSRAADAWIRDRLGAVQRLLRSLHQRDHGDEESIHQLRVASRRAFAVLQLFEDWLPQKRDRRLQRDLRRIRRAAGETRDLDVLLLRYRQAQEAGAPNSSSDAVISWLQDQRRKAVRSLHQVVRHEWKKRRFRRRCDSLIRRIRCRGKKRQKRILFGVWARLQLTARGSRFAVEANADISNPECLHELRIQVKQLRYTTEPLMLACAQPIRDRLSQRLSELQEQLGLINDHCVAREIFQRQLKRSSSSAVRHSLELCLEQESAALSQALQQLHGDSLLETLAEMQVEFGKVCQPEQPDPRVASVSA